MLGKIVQLRPIHLEKGFFVTYGVDKLPFDVRDFRFARLRFEELSASYHKTYIMGGYSIKDQGYGFKQIILSGCDDDIIANHKDEVEEYLFVIIPMARDIITNAEKVAGLYPEEAILVMHNGEIVEVSHPQFDSVETYVATKVGKEMFLLKKNR